MNGQCYENTVVKGIPGWKNILGATVLKELSIFLSIRSEERVMLEIVHVKGGEFHEFSEGLL